VAHIIPHRSFYRVRSLQFLKGIPVHDFQTLAFDLIASESELTIADVTQLYAAELSRLTSGSHIARFLPIFALQNVRESLRQRVSVRSELISD